MRKSKNNYNISPLISETDIYSSEDDFMFGSGRGAELDFLDESGPNIQSSSPVNKRNELEGTDFTDEKDALDKIIRPGVTLGDVFAAIFWLGSMAEDEGISTAEREYLDLAVYELSKFYFTDFYETKHLPKVVEAVEKIRETLIRGKEAAKS